MCFFPDHFQDVVSLFSKFPYDVSGLTFLWVYPVGVCSASWIQRLTSIAKFGKFAAIISLSTCSASPSFLSSKCQWREFRSFVIKAIRGISLSSNIWEQECSHVWQNIKTQILAENQDNTVFSCLISQYFLSLITELYYILSLLAKDCQSPNTDSWQSVLTQQAPVSISCWPGSHWLLVEQESPCLSMLSTTLPDHLKNLLLDHFKLPEICYQHFPQIDKAFTSCQDPLIWESLGFWKQKTNVVNGHGPTQVSVSQKRNPPEWDRPKQFHLSVWTN